jgi:hypothetical protein
LPSNSGTIFPPAVPQLDETPSKNQTLALELTDGFFTIIHGYSEKIDIGTVAAVIFCTIKRR